MVRLAPSRSPWRLLCLAKGVPVLVVLLSILKQISGQCVRSMPGNMVDLFSALLLLLSVLRSMPVEGTTCPSGCQCSTSAISCCKPGEYLPSTIVGNPNITKLNMNLCHALDITGRTFANLDNLMELTIRQTNIVFIDAFAFSGLKSLSSLMLNDVNLKSMDLHRAAFQDLQLQRLDLSNNSLTMIHSQMFSGLSKLQVLNLSRNKIALVQDGAFQSLLQLSLLSLDYNGLSTVTPFWFKPSANYSSLQISLIGNSLTKECQFRGLGITENQWFTMSIVPNISLSSEEGKAPECSPPSFSDLYREVYVQEPFPVGLVCTVKGLPMPKLTWLLPSGLPVSSSTPSYSVKSGMLILNRVQPSIAGLYACVATNSEGSSSTLYRLVVIPWPAAAPTTTATSTAITDMTTLRPTVSPAAASKTSLVLIWVCIGLLFIALGFFLFYILKKAFKWAKKKTSTGFEFNRFADTPNILMVPENPQPMPQV